MTLTNFKVKPTPDTENKIVVKADDGDTQVAAFITRGAINDCFPRNRLTDDERVCLVESNDNLRIIAGIISAKYLRGEARDYHWCGSTVQAIDITRDDLRTCSQLSGDHLLVARGPRTPAVVDRGGGPRTRGCNQPPARQHTDA
jgi:hypothetical protein